MADSVKIGGVTYRVREVETVKVNANARPDLQGYVDYEHADIQVDQALEPQIKAVVRWHEIVHAILHQAGHDDHEEAQIKALGFGIVQALRDNPWLGEVGL